MIKIAIKIQREAKTLNFLYPVHFMHDMTEVLPSCKQNTCGRTRFQATDNKL